MGFKKYIVASFLLIAIIAGYVYSLDLGDYTLTLSNLGFNQTLPIFVWVIVPTLVLFIASFLHMIFYNTKSYFTRKNMLKDISQLSIILKDRLLKKESSAIVRTQELKKVADILNQLDINIKDNNLTTDIKVISDVADKLNKINNGEYITIKELKLPNDNEIMQKDILNRINSDDNFAIEVLKNTDKYTQDMIEIAFANVSKNKSFDTLKKLALKMKLSNSMVKLFLLKDSTASKDFALTNSEILVYIQDNKFTNQELIQIAKNYKKHMSPEQLIKLYEDISANDESLTESYLYVLFEYEMVVQIREILINSQKDEYTIFKALLDLKDAGKYYSIDNLTLN
jgi:hypothetical protein